MYLFLKSILKDGYRKYIDACNYLKIPKSNASNISYCSKGYRQSAHGYKWKILNE